jgi:ribosomal-protein-alanine N-acetyltransferase
MNLYRIEADVTVGNLASAALLKKLHFKQEGLWRQRVFARDKFWDLWQFGLLKDE